MSTNVRALLRVQFLLAWRGFRENMGAGKSKWGLILLPLMALGFLPLIFMFGVFYVALYLGAQALGQGELLLVVVFTAGQLVCLMFGIFYVISAFYFSKDLNNLVPLPLRPGEIVLSKFASILVGEYLTIAPVVLPALVVYGVLADVSWLYIPFALIIYLLLPIFPVAVASIFSMVLMRVTNLRKNRDLWRVVGALVGVVTAIGFQFFARFQRGGPGSAQASLEALIQQQQGLIQAVGRYVPTSLWASEALREGAAGYGVIPLLLFVGVACLTLFLLMRVAEHLFFGGLLGGEESRSSGKLLSREELAAHTSQVRSPLWALVQREIRLFNRNPSFLLNGLMPILLLPFFVAIPVLQGQQGLGETLTMLRGVGDLPFLPIIGMGIILFMNAMSSLAATAISREGRHFWISRSLPVPPRVQMLGKLIHSLLFAVVNLLVIVGAMLFLRILSPLNLVYVVVGGLLASTAFNCGAIAIDIMRPSLKWTDPQKAMKGNTNGLFALLLAVLMGIVLGLTSGLLWFFLRPALVPGILLVLAGLSFGLYKLASALADRRYLEYAD